MPCQNSAIVIEDDDKIAIRFRAFHEQNPWVFTRLKELALAMKRRGTQQYGIVGLYETLRYEASLKTNKSEGFKLNNDFRALYARELARSEPELKDFFKFRERRPRGTQHVAPAVDAWDRPVAEQPR
jgi:hypothetical protein